MVYQVWGERLDRKRIPARGRLVDLGDHVLHVTEAGSGQPAVVFESGIAASSLSWAAVQPHVAEFSRTVSYDRAGLGWSTSSRKAPSVESMIGDLRALLSSAAIPPPYILAGHSFGALLCRAFAHSFPGDVAALVLVDPVSISAWAACSESERHRLSLGVRLSRRGALLAQLGVVRFALNVLVGVGTRFPRLVAKAAARRATSFLDRIAGEIRRLPPELWPAVRAHWSRPKSFRAMAGHLACLEASARSAQSMQVPGSIPVTVISASTVTPAELAERDAWVRGNERSSHIRLADCGHWIQLEKPDAVITAILNHVRTG